MQAKMEENIAHLETLEFRATTPRIVITPSLVIPSARALLMYAPSLEYPPSLAEA